MVSYTGQEYNTGDDIAGFVEKVGKDVFEYVLLLALNVSMCI